MYRYFSAYKTSAYANWYQLPFGVLYKGKSPTPGQARTAIKTHLLSLNLATEEIWKALLPDLFVNAMFYMIPMWKNTTELPEVTLKRGVVSHKEMSDVFNTIFPSYDSSYITNYLEVIKAAGNEMFIAVLPSNENEPADMELRNIHPTYQAIDSQSEVYDNMTTITQNFNAKLSDCIAMLDGGTNSTAFYEDTVDSYRFTTFVENSVEFYVLQPTSYPV